MRSTYRDKSNGTITFNANDNDNGTPSTGNGLAQPGNIPYSWIRTSTGVYQYYLPPGITALLVVSAAQGLVQRFAAQVLSAGGFTITVDYSTSPSNYGRSWTCTAIDRRS